MSDLHTQFVRGNQLSPVRRIVTAARSTTYHLEDGNVFKLNKAEAEALARHVTRTGYVIRLGRDLKRRIGE